MLGDRRQANCSKEEYDKYLKLTNNNAAARLNVEKEKGEKKEKWEKEKEKKGRERCPKESSARSTRDAFM